MGEIEKTVSSVAELLAAVKAANFDRQDHRHLRVWFRGHADAAWTLAPGVYRPTFPAKDEPDRLNRERHLSQDFRIFSAGLRSGDETDAQIYFLQQHYRMPTRLLDWTSNALAALYFAAIDCHGKDGEIFMMDAFRLSVKQKAKYRGISTARNPELISAMEIIFDWHNREFQKWIMPIRPEHFDTRINRQLGYFTFHGPDNPILTTQHNDTLKRFKIPKSAKPHILEELTLLSVNGFTIYGDLDHLADWLKLSRM